MQKYTKRKDGRYRARVWDGTYVDGEKHYIDVYSTKSSRDLELKVKEIEDKRQKGTVIQNKNVDIYAYTLDWIERTKSACEPSTKYTYMRVANQAISEWKGLTFDNFTYNNVQDLFNEFLDRPSYGTKLKILIKQIGKAAERDKLMPKGTTQEIFEQIRFIKYKPKERVILTATDKEKIATLDMPLMEKCFIWTLYYTGLRRSEALALTVDDVQGGFVTVNKAYGIADNGYYLKTTKSDRGTRKVPIPKKLQELYDVYVPTLAGKLLFSKDGKPLSKYAMERLIADLRKATGLEITLHNFRHNYCSALCYESIKNGNISPKKIAELLGDREEMVMNVYSHIIEEKEKVSEAIENALSLTT